jgi:hypothetical protein
MLERNMESHPVVSNQARDTSWHDRVNSSFMTAVFLTASDVYNETHTVDTVVSSCDSFVLDRFMPLYLADDEDWALPQILLRNMLSKISPLKWTEIQHPRNYLSSRISRDMYGICHGAGTKIVYVMNKLAKTVGQRFESGRILSNVKLKYWALNVSLNNYYEMNIESDHDCDQLRNQFATVLVNVVTSFANCSKIVESCCYSVNVVRDMLDYALCSSWEGWRSGYLPSTEWDRIKRRIMSYSPPPQSTPYDGNDSYDDYYKNDATYDDIGGKAEENKGHDTQNPPTLRDYFRHQNVSDYAHATAYITAYNGNQSLPKNVATTASDSSNKAIPNSLQSCYVFLQHHPPSTTIHILIHPSFFSLLISLLYIS